MLAVPAKAPTLQSRHLMRELVDLQLLALEFLVTAGKLRVTLGESRDQRRCQIAQFLCVHLSQLSWQLHGL